VSSSLDFGSISLRRITFLFITTCILCSRAAEKRFDAARLKILLAIPLLRTAQATRSASAVLLLDKSLRSVCLGELFFKSLEYCIPE
jgi:hypothetical protein